MVRPNAQTIQTDGPYGDGPFIRQAIAPEAIFRNQYGDSRYPILGLWMIDQDASGLGIRESAGPITDNLSSFIPHYFV
jgi:glutathionylspermidine synthase